MKPRRRTGTQKRSIVKRARIIETAMRHFAERGFQEARVEDMAKEMGIAKGSIFQHFKTKNGLFLAVYKEVITQTPAYLDVPAEVAGKGFFEILRYWLHDTRTLEDRLANRVLMIGDFGVDLQLRAQITRFLATYDPYAIGAFVRWGIERRDLRADLDPELMKWLLHWWWESFQDAMLLEEMDPGLFRRPGKPPVAAEGRIEQFIEAVRSALGRR